MARIFVVEDDGDVREELVRLLFDRGHELILPSSFDTVVEEIVEAQADLILLDLGLPNNDGQYVIHELRRKIQTPLIVLTSRASDLDELCSLSFGADDYLTKPYNAQVLCAHIDAVLKRTQAQSDSLRLVSRGDLHVDFGRACVTYKQKTAKLTKNELQILDVLLKNAGQVVSREEIKESLWNSDAFVDDNTLTVNINRLRRQLKALGAQDPIVTYRGLGYLLQ